MIDKQTANIRKLLKDLDDYLDVSLEAELVNATMEVERWDGRKALMAEKRQNASNQLLQLNTTLQEAKAEVELLLVQEQEKKVFSEATSRISIKAEHQAVRTIIKSVCDRNRGRNRRL